MCLKKDCEGQLYWSDRVFICTKNRKHVFTLKEVEEYYETK